MPCPPFRAIRPLICVFPCEHTSATTAFLLPLLLPLDTAALPPAADPLFPFICNTCRQARGGQLQLTAGSRGVPNGACSIHAKRAVLSSLRLLCLLRLLPTVLCR